VSSIAVPTASFFEADILIEYLTTKQMDNGRPRQRQTNPIGKRDAEVLLASATAPKTVRKNPQKKETHNEKMKRKRTGRLWDWRMVIN
tara:strand:- start:167 stop:430 length:264 start_codon:yes stop_codon:yes gene_type:complete